MTDFTLNSKKCLVQAEVFKTRAFIAAIRGLAKTINSDLSEDAAKEFKLASHFVSLMDDASDNALKFSTEE